MINRIDPRALGALEPSATPRKPAAAVPGSEFANLLHQSLQPVPVKFSAHAQQRLEDRGVSFDTESLAQIAQAVDEVAAKGGRESLVITDTASLVVNVPKRTVITVLSPSDEGNTIVTNIDSAVVAQARPAPEDSNTTLNRPAPERGGLGAADRSTRRHTLEV